MKQMDDNIGYVLKSLEAWALDNTVVVFTTDNGAEQITYPDGRASVMARICPLADCTSSLSVWRFETQGRELLCANFLVARDDEPSTVTTHGGSRSGEKA